MISNDRPDFIQDEPCRSSSISGYVQVCSNRSGRPRINWLKSIRGKWPPRVQETTSFSKPLSRFGLLYAVSLTQSQVSSSAASIAEPPVLEGSIRVDQKGKAGLPLYARLFAWDLPTELLSHFPSVKGIGLVDQNWYKLELVNIQLDSSPNITVSPYLNPILRQLYLPGIWRRRGRRVSTTKNKIYSSVLQILVQPSSLRRFMKMSVHL